MENYKRAYRAQRTEKESRDLPTDLRKKKRERAEIWKLVSEGRLGEGGYRPYKGL